MIARYASLRVFGYFLAITAFFGLVTRLSKAQGPMVVFQEHGFIEQVQFFCIVLSSIGLLTLARLHPRLRGLFALAGTVGVLAIMRELNNTDLYQRIFFNGAVGWVLAGVILPILLFKFRRGLLGQIDHFLKLPATALLLGGFVIVVGWAQIFAHKTIFTSKEADRIVEEGLEAAGYLLILTGIIELWFNLRKSDSDKRP